MRLAKIIYANPNMKSEGDWNILLDTKEDVICYFELIKGQHSDDVIDFWFQAKDAEKNPMISYGHYTSGNGTKEIAHMFISSIKEGESVSISEYCNHMDAMLVQKFHRLLNIIDIYGSAKVNMVGGYSQFDDFYKIIEEMDATPIMVSKYLQGDEDFISKETININCKRLIIENDSFISGELTTFLKSYGWNNGETQILSDFKLKTRGYNQHDFIDMFSKAIYNGLETIIVETTMLDSNQFKNMQKIIEYVVSITNSKLNIFILKVGEFDDIISNNENLIITNL